MEIVHKISLDFSREQNPPHISVMQGDTNTRAVKLSLTANNQPWPVPDGVTAAVAFRKPDGTKGLYDTLPDGTEATTISGSTVTAVFAPQMLTAAGVVHTAVILTDAALNQLGTFPLSVDVQPNPAAGDQVSNNYYYLQNLDQVNQAYNELLERMDTLEQGGSGISNEEKKVILTLFKNIAYTADMSAKVAELEAFWSVSYKVTYNLTGATASNNAAAVVEGGSYTTTLTAEAGYTMTGATVKVTMGGRDITSTAYKGGVVTIESVTGAVVITVAAAELASYSITNNLTNVVNSNEATRVVQGDFYSASLTWEDGYSLNSIIITMGGVDVTADVYGEGNILITEVTGDIVITAVAGLPAPVYLLENRAFDGSSGQVIDTGIALFDTDKDWSIFIELTTEDKATTSWRCAAWHKSAESTYADAVMIARWQWNGKWVVKAVTSSYDVSDTLDSCVVVVTHTKGASKHQYYGVVGGEIVTGDLTTRGVGTDGTLKIGGCYNYEETAEGDGLFIGTINTAEVHLRVLTEAEIREKLGVA